MTGQACLCGARHLHAVCVETSALYPRTVMVRTEYVPTCDDHITTHHVAYYAPAQVRRARNRLHQRRQRGPAWRGQVCRASR